MKSVTEFVTENAVRIACSMMESPKMLETINAKAKEKDTSLLDIISENAVCLTGKILKKVMKSVNDCANTQYREDDTSDS